MVQMRIEFIVKIGLVVFMFVLLFNFDGLGAKFVL